MKPTFPDRLRILLAVVLQIVFLRPLFGENLYFEHRDISDLTVPTVRDIDEDFFGYIWAATPGGLIRYNGKNPELWDRNEIPELPSEDIQCLAFEEDSDVLWIGTDAGMVMYDFSTGSARTVSLIPIARPNASHRVIDIEISPEFGVFSVTEDGAYRYAGNGRMEEIQFSGGGGTGERFLSDLTVDSDGTIWAVSSEGLETWNAGSGRFERQLDIREARVVESIDDSLWIGGDERKIYRYGPASGIAEVFDGPDNISGFASDESDGIWISSLTAGLSRLDPVGGGMVTQPVDSEHPYGLSSGRIDCLHQSGSRIWIGSVDTGLISLNLVKTNNLTYTVRSGSNSLPIGPVSVIREDSLGYLWTGSRIGGLARIDPFDGGIDPYNYNESDHFSIRSDHITSVLEDSTGSIWVGTDRGPALYISEIEGFELPGAMLGGWPDLRNRYVMAMTEGGDGSIWMSLRSGSVYKFDILNRDYRVYAFSPASVPRVMFTDRYGSVWTGSRTNIRLFRGDGELVSTWDLESGTGTDVLKDGITAIHADTRERIWFGGPGGAAVYDPLTGLFSALETLDERRLSVSGITEDDAGNLWIANEKVIHLYDGNGEHLSTIDSCSGFNPAGFISGIIRSLSGSILVGANGELWTFNDVPGEITSGIPEVHINSIRIAGKEELRDFRSDNRLIRIQPDQNSIQIDFDAVDFESGGDIRIEHRLDGLDDTWFESNDSRQIHYANLPYRDLVFSVRAYNAATGERGSETSLNISVDKPAWQNWWAILLEAAGVALFIGIIVKLREGALLKSQVQDLEEARSEALKANQKLEILTMNDTLSGLLNRRGFDKAVAVALNTASRTNQMISLFMMDVDFFKRYNDNYGHVAGDEVLRGVGRALKSVFGRSTDIIARYGGEEFAVVFIGENPDALVLLANDLLRTVHNLDITHGYSDADSRLTLSIGSATIRATKELTAMELVNLSDRALYASKNSGRKRVCFAGIIPELPEKMMNGTAPIVLESEA